MNQAIKDAWELVEIIGMLGIIIFALLLISPLAIMLWVTSWGKEDKEQEVDKLVNITEQDIERTRNMTLFSKRNGYR